MKIETYIVTKY